MSLRREREADIPAESAGRLIVVANRLPVSLVEDPNGTLSLKTSPGGMAAALAPVLSNPSTIWVGYAGSAQLPSPQRLTKLGMPNQLHPLAIPDELYARYYLGVANGSLWPICHGMRPRRMHDQEDWQAYTAVNTQFADAIASVAGPNDVIWIHDFHLFLLPKLLRKRGIHNRIGHFLHVPFPSPSTFSHLPHYQEILDSLCTADLCGVQTARDVRHLRSCLKTFAANKSMHPHIQAFPVGIDYTKYNTAPNLPAVRKQTQMLRRRLAGRKVIFSLSRLDYTKGILEQLDAIEQLLMSGREVVYKLVVAPSREDLGEYRQLKQSIDERVAQINEHFTGSTATLDYEYRNMGFEELASWYCCADVMLVTPLIDGMNLVAKEYIATRPNNDGVLVLSKTAGAAGQLKDALLVNPRDTAAVTRALQQALAMPGSERHQRNLALRKNVEIEDAYHWAQSFQASLASSGQV